MSPAILTRLDRFAATKELQAFTDLEVADLLTAYKAQHAILNDLYWDRNFRVYVDDAYHEKIGKLIGESK